MDKPQIISCKKCGYTDSEIKFPIINKQFGRTYYRKLCKPCYNIYQLERKTVRAGQKPATRPWPYPEE